MASSTTKFESSHGGRLGGARRVHAQRVIDALRGGGKRLGVAFSVVAVCATALVFSPTAQSVENTVVEEGRIAAAPKGLATPRGELVLDSDKRIGYRLYRDPASASLAIWTFDLDTMADLRHVVAEGFPANVPQKFGFQVALGGGRLAVTDEYGWVHSFDADTLERKGYYPSILPPPSGSVVGVGLREQRDVGVRRTADGARTPVHPLVAGPGHRILDMTYLPSLDGNTDGEIAILSHGYVNEADVPFAVLTLHRWDAKTGREIATTRLAGCSSGRAFGNTTRSATGLALTKGPDGTRQLIYGCIGRGLIGEVWTATVGDDGSISNETQRSAVSTASDFLVDPKGRRVHALTSAGVGQSFVASDLDRGGVIGAVGLSFAFDSGNTSSGLGAAINPKTGRLYAMSLPSADANSGKSSPGGLVLVDGRRSPLPQGFAYPEHAHSLAEMLVVDPGEGARPTRIFARVLDEPFYRIYADRVPVQKDPPISELDKFTVDVAEEDGVTRAAFSAGVNGYGARMLLVGGTNALPDPISNVRGESFTKDMVTGFVANPGCGSTNREIIMASIAPTTGLSDTAATATAQAGVADPRTIQDLGEPINSCFPWPISRTTFSSETRPEPDDYTLGTNAFANTKVPGSDDNVDRFVGPEWPFSEAVCLPPTRNDDAAPHDGDQLYDGVGPPAGWRAEVSCDLETETLTATAVGTGGELGAVKVGPARTTATIDRTAGEGVDITVTSRVDGIDLGAGIKIGSATATATSEAAGRKGTAKTSFSSLLCGVVTPTFTESGCFDPRAESSKPLIDGLNQILSRRDMEIRLPSVDGDLAKGTPGGSLAGVQKDRFVAQGERLFNNDFLTAVPAFELLRIHDSTNGRGRQIMQFAGVQASTAYNISLIPTFTGGGISTTPDPVDPGPIEVLPQVIERTVAPAASLGDFVDGGFPTPGAMVATVLSTVSYVLRYALRSPGEALGVVGLMGVAFALPLHLLDRRKAVLDALTKGS